MNTYKYIAVLALVLASCAAASTKSDDGESGLGIIKANIQLPNGNTITQVSYSLDCSPTPVPTTEATGTWPVVADSDGQAIVNATIGGLDPNDTCNLVLSAQDSYGLDNGNVQNCTGEADGVQVGVGMLGISLFCNDNGNVVSGPLSTGNLTTNITVTTAQNSQYQCSGIGWYTSTQYYVSGYGYGYYLNMGVSIPTSPQTVTWSSDNSNATWYEPYLNVWSSTFTLIGNPETDPVTSANTLSALGMSCNTQGTFNITLTVQDTTPGFLLNGQPWSCPPATDTFQVNCY
jgi:hypothetical protein